MAEMKPENVKVGDWLYIGSSFYIDHGEDDRCGGLARVSKVTRLEYNVNDYNVEFDGIDHTLNLTAVLREQGTLRAEYGNKLAHQCPEGKQCPNPKVPDRIEALRAQIEVLRAVIEQLEVFRGR